MPNKIANKAINEASTPRINWKRIAGKAGNGAKTIFAPVMPATINTVNSVTNIRKDLRAATRASNTAQISKNSQMKNSVEAKRSTALFKTALEDIGNGSYDVDKISSDLSNDYDNLSDSFTMPTGDDAAQMSSEEIILASNAGIARSVMQAGNAQLRGLQAVSKSIIRSNVNATQAMSGMIMNSLNHGFNLINTSIMVTNQKLDIVSGRLDSLIQFNNKNTIEFYTKSIDMMNGLGQMMETFQKSLNPDPRKRRNFDTSNGFDIKAYIDYVKSGLQETLFGSTTETIKNITGKRSGSYGGSARNMGIVGNILSAVLPKALTKPFEDLDKSVQRFFNQTLIRIGDALDNHEYLGSLGLGSVFGKKRSVRNKLDLSIYQKDAMPWNGLAQKALVEVIPELLTSIDAGINKTEKRYYDYNTGKFKSKSKIEESFKEEYFDQIIFSLKDSMEALQEIAKNSGRNEQDQESLIRKIEAMIDDQITGKADHQTTKRNMERSLYDFGVGESAAKRFMEEFQAGIEEGLEQINDLFHEIGSTQHIYRNITNTSGKEYTRELDRRHDSHSASYRTLTRIPDPSKEISDIQRKLGLTDIDLSKDPDLISEFILLTFNKATEQEIAAAIAQAYRNAKLKENILSGNDRLGAFIERQKERATRIGDRFKPITNRISDELYEIGYGQSYYRDPNRNQQTASQNRGQQITSQGNIVRNANNRVNNEQTPTQKVGKASTYFSRQRTQYTSDSKTVKAAEIGMSAAMSSYDDIMGQSTNELDKDQLVLSKAIDEANKEAPASSYIESVIQSNNMVKTALGAMIAHLQGFSSRLFGKEGFFRKIWDSDIRKKTTEKIKKKLFTGENAVFKDQYEAAKKGLKNIGLKTRAYIGRGYDYLYDNTMQYLYGYDEEGNPIRYQDNEKYKNNKFLSQTINRRWRRAQARKKRAEAEKKKQQEEAIKNGEIISSVNKPDNIIESTISDKETSIKKVVSLKKESNIANPTEQLKTVLNDTIDEVKKSADNLQESTDAAVKTIAGDVKESPESKEKKYKSDFVKKMKATIPKALAGAIGGLTIGALNNSFSILGSMFLPGGPIAGAIVGGGLAILSQTEAFKTFMFGKLDEKTQKREGGLINEKTRKKFRQLAPAIVGGAVVGGLSSILKGALGFNTGLGVLGMQILPGGILGGAMLGAGMGILKNSETFKSLLFGKKGEDGKRSGTIISNGWNKAKSAFAALLPKGKAAAKGLAVGALTGTVLANMGYLPAMLSMGGPVGMGVLGLGVGIASTTKKFNEWMFGTEMLDKDGNVIGRNKDGMLTRVTNILRTNIIEPIADTFKNKMLDLVDWTKDKITYPFRLAFGPILDSLIGIKDSVVDFVKDKFETLGEGIMSMMRKTMKSLFSPITKLVGFVGKSMLGMASTGAKLTMAPLSLGLQAMSLLTMGKRRKEYIEFYKNYYAKGNIMSSLQDKWAAEEADGKKRNIFQKMSDTVGAFIGQGEIADAARAGWNAQQTEDGRNHLRWRNVNQERRQLRENRKQRRKEERQWNSIDKLRSKIINNELGGREVEFNDATVKAYREKFAKLGIDEKYLQSSEDIMDLLYRKRDFKNRMKSDKDGSLLMGNESPEQAEARKKTGEYQDHVKTVLDEIAKRFGILAKDSNDKKRLSTLDEDWSRDLEKLKKRLKKRGVHGINLDDPSLRDYEINQLDDDLVNAFRWSTEYHSGDIKGFMDRMKIRKKSEYVEEDNSPEDDPSNGFVVNEGIKIQDTPAQEEYKNRVISLIQDISEAVTGKDKSSPLTLMSNNFTTESNSPQEILSKLSNQVTDLIDTTEENRDINKDQLNEQREETGDRKGFISNLFKSKKKKARDDKESAEGEAARSLGDKKDEFVIDEKKIEEKKEEENPLKEFWSKIKGVGMMLVGSSVGKFAISAIKFGGAVGLLGTIGLTIAELIRPGTAEMVGAKIDEFNERVQSDDFTLETIINDFKLKASELGNTILDNMGWFGDAIQEKVVPKVTEFAVTLPEVAQDILYKLPDMAKSFASFVDKNAETIVSTISTVITSVAPPLIEALFISMPTIIKAIGKGLFEGLKGLGKQGLDFIAEGLGFKPKAEVKNATEEEAQKDFQETGRRYRVNENTTKKEKISEAAANDTLLNGSLTDKSKIIQNVATGQYYIYTKDDSIDVIYLSDEDASIMINDQNTVNEVWFEPSTERFFIEKRTLTAWSDSTYVTIDGEVKNVSRKGQVLANAAQFGVTAATKGTMAAKGVGVIAKGATAAGKFLAKNSKLAGKLASIGLKIPEYGFKAVGTVAGWAGHAPLVGSVFKLTSFVSNTTGNIIGGISKIVAKFTGNAAQTANVVNESSESFLKQFLNKIKTGLSKIKSNSTLQKVLEKTDKLFGIKAGEVLAKFADKLMEYATKHIGSATGEMATKLASMISKKATTSVIASIPLTTLLMTAWGAVSGALSAANLFGVPSDKVDVKMTLISTFLEAVMNTSVVSWVDLVFSVVDAATNGKVDIKSEIACYLYKVLSLNEAEATAKLADAQSTLDNETAIYNALNNLNISTENYNDKVNTQGIFAKIGKGIKTGFNWLTGNEEKTFQEYDAYNVYNKILTDAGYSSETIQTMDKQAVTDAIKANVDSSTSITDKERSLVKSSLGFGSGSYGIKINNNKEFMHIPQGYGTGSNDQTLALSNQLKSSMLKITNDSIDNAGNTQPYVKLDNDGSVRNIDNARLEASMQTIGTQISSLAKIFRNDIGMGNEVAPYVAIALLSLLSPGASLATTGMLVPKLSSMIQDVIQNNPEKIEKFKKTVTTLPSSLQQLGSLAISTVANQIKEIPKSIANTTITTLNGLKTLFGKAKSALGFGNGDYYKQGNNQWANMPIGYFSNGKVATMKTAGCGPTALAAVANQLQMGYGPGIVSPAKMASYAASNGYISNGGANAGLFTEGAARLGMRSSPVANTKQLVNNLSSGRPTILTGKSSSSNDPYTSAGHIVVADRMVGNKARVLDPITGKRKLYNINDISKSTNHAWTYSLGYGPTTPSLGGLVSSNTLKNLESTLQSSGYTKQSTPTTTTSSWNTTSMKNRLKSNVLPTYNALPPQYKKLAEQISQGKLSPNQLPMAFSNTLRNNIIKAAEEIKANPASFVAGKTSSDLISFKTIAPSPTEADIMRFSNKKSNPGRNTSNDLNINGGIMDYGAIHGYNTGVNGVDTAILTNNKNYFMENDGYYRRNFATEMQSLYRYKTIMSRNGSMYTASLLAFLLTTQYFPLVGGTYGTINIQAYDDANGGTPPDVSTYNKDRVTEIFAAAVISEKNKGTTITKLSDVEKFIAYANGLRVIYGLKQAIKHIVKNQYSSVIQQVTDEDYVRLANAATSIDGTSASQIASELATTSSTGITSIEQLEQIANTRSFFGRLKLAGKVLQAKVNSMLSGRPFMVEFEELTRDEVDPGTGNASSNENTATNSGGTIKLNGAGAQLSKMIATPQNIQEELLGKTLENAYYNESSGNYALVTADDGGYPSIGPYQARNEYAAKLLNNLRGVQGIPNDVKEVYRKYATLVQQGPLSKAQAEELSRAMGNTDYQSGIRKEIDRSAMELYNNRYFRQWYAKKYDNGTFKDFRSLAMIADIGHTGPGYIVGLSNKNSKWSGKEFFNRWKPTSKEAEFDAVYNELIRPGTFYEVKGYKNRLKNDYNNLKNYQFKTTVPQGRTLQYMFDEGTNPLGFGPTDGTSNTTSQDIQFTDTSANAESGTSFSTWGQQMAQLTDAILSVFGSTIGSPSDFGLTTTTTSSGAGSATSNTFGANVSSNGSSSGGEVLTSLSGTDKGRVLAAAKSQLGYLEKRDKSNLKSFTANAGDNNYTKYGAEIGSNPNAWCAYFTSWLGKAADIPTSIYPRDGSCTNLLSKYKSKGQFIYRTQGNPQPGDLVLFQRGWTPISDPTTSSSSGHVGLVTGFDGNNVYTIEGNTGTSFGVGGVAEKTRKLSEKTILGYARPAYTGESKTVNPSELLSLGYGKNDNYIKVDDPIYREKLRSEFEHQPEYNISPKDFESLGFGPGMRVDAGFDMSSTDGKLDQIFSVIAEWYNESKKKASGSTDNKNINVITQNTNNVVTTRSGVNDQRNDVSSKYKKRMMAEHATLSYRQNIRNMM